MARITCNTLKMITTSKEIHMPTKVLLGENVKKKKLIALISCIVVLALALTGLGSYWYFKQSEETNKARKQCQEEVAKISKPNKTWKKLVGNSFLVTLAQQDSENSKKLASLLAEKAPEPITCNANSAEELGKQSAQAIAASQWYKDESTKIRSLAVSLVKEMKEKQDKDKDKDKDKDDKNADKNKDTSVNKKEETKRTPNPVVKHPVKQNNQTKTGKTTPNKNTPKTNKGKTGKTDKTKPGDKKTGDKDKDKDKDNKDNKNNTDPKNNDNSGNSEEQGENGKGKGKTETENGENSQKGKTNPEKDNKGKSNPGTVTTTDPTKGEGKQNP